jgi:hypothetical protein
MLLFLIESSCTRAAFAKIENNWSYAEPQLKKMGIHTTNLQVPFENRVPHWQPRRVRLIFAIFSSILIFLCYISPSKNCRKN